MIPFNAVTGTEYQGGNIARLAAEEIAHEYGPGGWAGFGQWLKAGRVVRKGEKGTHGKTVCRVTDDDGRTKTTARGFVVFHYDQTAELETVTDTAVAS